MVLPHPFSPPWLPLNTAATHTFPARRLKPVAAGVLLACAASTAYAQAPSAPLALQESPWLQETLPPASTRASTVITADRVEGQVDLDLTATGKVELRQPGSVLRADQLRYDAPSDTATATGSVYIQRMGNIYRGDRLQLQVDAFAGSFDNVKYSLLQTGGVGTASRIDFLDDHHSIGHDTIYTTCRLDERAPGVPNPAWYIKGKRILIDKESDTGYVEDGALVFQGVPLIPLYGGVSFPLSSKRQSGLLSPTIGFGGTDGFKYSQPYYFDIAPNRDATLTPSVMTKRGTELFGQFRYLEDSYKGQIDAEIMPNDQLRERKRWRYRLAHTQAIPTTDWGTFGLNIDLLRVSDDNYWRDFSSFGNRFNALTERTLPSTTTLNWNLGNWSAWFTDQRWQTLQQPDVITPPYDKSPQVHVRYNRYNVNGFDVSLDLDSTRFKSSPALTGYPNGTRSYALGQISYPWIQPWGYVTPTLQLHAAHYNTDGPMADGRSSASRVLPTATVDSGLVFERDTTLFGRKVQQTLEPQLFLAYTPYKDQSTLPVYDSAVRDFNMASIFSANPFSGDDRIADAQSATAGVTTRFFDANDGAELARFSAAARQQTRSRRVVLNTSDTPGSYSFSNLLFEGDIRWNPQWNARGTLQWDPESKRSIRSVLGANYHPGPYRTISINYNMQRAPLTPSKQVDVGWQWPINNLWGDKGLDLGPGRGQGAGRWYSVGRVYYSLQDKRLVDSIIGLEYDSCCWIGRVALQRRQTQVTPAKYDNRIMFQLEFVGLSRLGTGAVQSFQSNIPNYMLLRDRTIERSRFQQYD